VLLVVNLGPGDSCLFGKDSLDSWIYYILVALGLWLLGIRWGSRGMDV
jgi:hypothetical protein